MIYLLDTNACIDWLRNKSPLLVARVYGLTANDIKLCSIVVGELEYGVERSDPAYRNKTAQEVERLCGRSSIRYRSTMRLPKSTRSSGRT